MRIVYISLMFVILCIIACSSPQKSLDKGNYQQAFSSALKNLQKGKSERRDRTVLNEAFDKLSEEKLFDAEKYLASNMLEDWEISYRKYDELIDLYDDGKRYLSSDFDPMMEEVQLSKDTLQRGLALNYFDLGEMSMAAFDETQNKLAAQEAHYYFDRVRTYDRDFPEILDAIDEALEKGVILVLVEADAPFETSYSWEINNEFDEVERESSEYVEIRYNRLTFDADCVLEINFGRIDVNRDQSSRTENFTEEVEDGFETQRDTSGREVRIQKYKTVEGTVRTISENLTYRWEMAVRPSGIREYCDYNQRFFNAEERLTLERYELSGDRDAIPSRYRQNNDRRVEEDEVVEELIEELYDQFVRYYF